MTQNYVEQYGIKMLFVCEYKDIGTQNIMAWG